MVSLSISVLALILTALGYYENRRSNNIQLRQALALEESNRIARGEGGEAVAATPIPNAPTSFTPSRWPALTLLILLLMNLGVTSFDYYDLHHKEPTPFVDSYVGKEPPKHEWRNEEVPLDGFKYDDCVMENVTFVYDGLTPIQFTHDTVRGFDFKSSNPAISMWMIFLKGVGALDNNLKLILPPGTRTDIPYEPAH
jgi:hypothetical protein